MQGTIQVRQLITQAQEGSEGLRRLRERQERIEEGEALNWLRKADTEAEENKVKDLYGKALKRYWMKCGYASQWITMQLKDNSAC